jgi:hypothetical protein
MWRSALIAGRLSRQNQMDVTALNKGVWVRRQWSRAGWQQQPQELEWAFAPMAGLSGVAGGCIREQ